MAVAVYSLCMLTALSSALLLLRGYKSSGAKLLFWSSLCFFGIAANNLVLFFDLLVFTQTDLYGLRLGLALSSMLLLLYGLIWEIEQ
jgi:hypothetical protein